MISAEPKAILWANVSALMRHHRGKENLTRLARESGVGPGTATRIKEQSTSVGLDVLQSVARCFDLQAWHLLTPNLDPSNPPVIYLCREEAALYSRMKTDFRELLKASSDHS